MPPPENAGGAGSWRALGNRAPGRDEAGPEEHRRPVGAGAASTPMPVPLSQSSAGSHRSQGESSLFTRELWLSASHILREFAPLQQLATRKEDEEANDDESVDADEYDAGGSNSFEGEGDRRKLLLVMVGLPARGKSFIAHRLTNYLTWYGLRTRVFNVGAYRRAVGGNEDAEFFDASNKDALATREHLAWTVFSELLQWLTSGKGDVGIFDATNTTGGAPGPRQPRLLRTCVPACCFLLLATRAPCSTPAACSLRYVRSALRLARC